MSKNDTRLLFEWQKGLSDFAYFQLGVAASAIAFAVHETTGVSLSQAPWPFGLAVLLWAVSFALGCFGVDARHFGIHSNALFLQSFPDFESLARNPATAQTIENAADTVIADLRRPQNWFRWQKWALFAGAVAFVSGHIMQMAMTPPKIPAPVCTSTPILKAKLH